MIQVERKILEWIEKYILVLAFIAITVIGTGIRFSLKGFQSADFVYYLEPWYRFYKENGGVKVLYADLGNYNIPYLTLMALLSYTPMSSLGAVKLLSCVFDFLLAGAAGYFIWFLTDDVDKKKTNALLAYSLVLVSPVVFLNSSAWAQCDAIYSFFCVVALVAFAKDKYKTCFILFGAALGFKLQAIFLLPFFVFAYLKKKNFSILHFLLIPVTMEALCIVGIISGKGIFDVFTIYAKQTDYYSSLICNYPSFYRLFTSLKDESLNTLFHTPAMLLAMVLLGILLVYWIRVKIELTPKNILYCAFMMVYTAVLFMPSMHDRYGYLYEVLAILIAFVEWKTIPLLVILNILSLSTYSVFLFAENISLWNMSFMNLLVYIAYLVILNRKMLKENKTQLSCSEATQ